MAGFGLGYAQVAGDGDITMPRQYFEEHEEQGEPMPEHMHEHGHVHALDQTHEPMTVPSGSIDCQFQPQQIESVDDKFAKF